MAIVSLNEKENDEVLALQLQLQVLKELLKEARASQHASQKAAHQAQIALENELQTKKSALDELSALYSQFDILKKRFVDADARAKQFEHELQNKSAREEQLSLELEYTKNALHNAEKQLVQLQENFDGMERHLEETLILNQQLQHESGHAVQVKQEAEEQLRLAHLHLAKKVRDNAELCERLDQQDINSRELSLKLEEHVDTIQQLQSLLEQKSDKEKQALLNAREALESAQALSASWESKYHQLYEKLHEYKLQLDECAKIETKYKRMCALWSSIGGILNENSDAGIDEETLLRMRCQETNPLGKPYQNLFDISRSQKSFSNTFE